MQTLDATNRSRAWLIVLLMVLFMLINFADKAIIGLAAGPIMKDLGLTNEQFGSIGSAFFLLFSLSAALVGFVVDRFSTKNVLALMALVWALTQLPMIGTVSVSMLVASRIVLGAGEGPAYPVALHAVYKWFPKQSRSFPTSLVNIGAPIGVGCAAPVLTWVIVHYSWHAAFGLLGALGFLWLITWMLIGKDGPMDDMQETAVAEIAAGERLSYASTLLSRTFVGVTLAGFAAYWALTLAVVWLPSFLIKAAGFSPIATGWIVMFPPLLQIVLSPALGLLSEALRRRGVSSRWAGGGLVGGAVIVAGIAMLLLSRATDPVQIVPLVTVAFALASIAFALGPPLISEVSPSYHRGLMLGLSNGIFSLAGLVAPWLMGRIVDVGVNPAQGFRDGFLFAGWLIIAGGAVAMILIDPQSDLARRGRADGHVAFTRAGAGP